MTHYNEAKLLKKLYIITVTDDTNYDFAGYILKPAETGTSAPNKSLLISVKKSDGTIDATLTAKSIYGSKEYHGETVSLTRGYLYWDDITAKIGTAFTYQPCWNTKDQVLVKGVTVRTVNGKTSAKDIAVEDVKGE